MKKLIPSLLSLILLGILVITSCTNRISQNAKYKTESEVNKKVNKGIESVFNEDEPQKDNESTASTNTPTQPEKPSGDQSKIKTDTIKPKASDPQLNQVKSDFIPGHKVIFWDSLANEQMGEFPSRWDLKNGSVENMNFDGHNVIGFTANQSEIFPLIDKENYLPEMFTIEFDCYFHNQGNEAYYINFKNISTNIRINIDGVNAGDVIRTEVKNRVGWRHIELSFNTRALKLYYEGERLLNIPRFPDKPTAVSFGALSHGRSKGKYAFIKNIRIAEGGVPLYDRLMTEGKIVTNDIHFDYSKATLKPESKKTIDEIVELMKSHPEIRFSIEGHTDSDGTDASNQTLSLQRANAVKEAMVKNGINESRLQTKGLGESKPIDTNDTPEGKAHNRRVEFIKL